MGHRRRTTGHGKTGQIVGVIPARWASSRLPGKPLTDLAGKPMIRHVVERVSQARLLDEVIVATDDARILQVVEDFGGRAVMTDPGLASGTDRVAEAVRSLDADIVVNIQGDEPLIPARAVDEAARILLDDPSVEMGTLVTAFRSAEELFSPHTAKVVTDDSGFALYFSRSPIPFCRDASDPSVWLKRGVYRKHIGIYVYRKTFLLRFAGWKPGRLEEAEKLEQLRALAHGVRIRVAETEYDPVCVDTPEDAERVRTLLRERPSRFGDIYS
ncbi:MAG TPA: 3-deoxy-manno-octulosonate cytidylyltransferase [bacterium]|nr:3-deoxy-manno-octulosonate cytidylyltransferase [bacterium]